MSAANLGLQQDVERAVRTAVKKVAWLACQLAALSEERLAGQLVAWMAVQMVQKLGNPLVETMVDL